jgi:hypothetical protein
MRPPFFFALLEEMVGRLGERVRNWGSALADRGLDSPIYFPRPRYREHKKIHPHFQRVVLRFI